MALHELATNALKYGALSTERGRVRIEWSIDGNRFELTWQETGGPTVKEPTRTGFGSRMIERALSASVDGEAKVSYLAEGIRFQLLTTVAAMQANNP